MECENSAADILNRMYENAPVLDGNDAILAYCNAARRYENFLRELEASGNLDPKQVDSAVFAINKLTGYFSEELASLKQRGVVIA